MCLRARTCGRLRHMSWPRTFRRLRHMSWARSCRRLRHISWTRTCRPIRHMSLTRTCRRLRHMSLARTCRRHRHMSLARCTSWTRNGSRPICGIKRFCSNISANQVIWPRKIVELRLFVRTSTTSTTTGFPLELFGRRTHLKHIQQRCNSRIQWRIRPLAQ